jgi:ABC-type antimicrobial peptide transport system permease subunit
MRLKKLRCVAPSILRSGTVGDIIFFIFAGVVLDAGFIGIRGVLSFLGARHTREFGIRIALGAQRSAMRSEPLCAVHHD